MGGKYFIKCQTKLNIDTFEIISDQNASFDFQVKIPDFISFTVVSGEVKMKQSVSDMSNVILRNKINFIQVRKITIAQIECITVVLNSYVSLSR